MKNCYLLAATLLTSLVSFAQSRVTDDLLHLYTFGEGSGQYIHDLSTDNIPLILEIRDPSHVSWGNPGLTINEPTLIRSISSADELNTNVPTSGEISLEAWITPWNLSQDGPARIITVSNGSSDRNVMIGQDEDTYVCRMRTTDTDNNGIPNSNSPGGSVELNLQHIIYTRNASGEEHIFLNGESVHQGQRDGDLSNWSSAFHLALGNEIGADRAFVGTYHLVAAYDRALSAEEVMQNFNAGAVQPGATPSESTCETEFCWIDGFGASRRSLWLPNLPDDVDRRFEFDENGGHFDVFEDGTAHIYGHCINQYDEDYGFYVDFWFTERKNWEEWSDLGRGWKGDPNIVGDLYETWDYYIMDEDQDNVLIGTGLFEGSLLNVTHKPSDYYYGLQVGEAANDQNAEPGMSCWFDYTGQINGDDVSGNGDINLEGECNDIQVMNCAVDVTVDCVDGGFTPDITGEPTIYCEEEYTLTYADEVISEDCPLIIERTWTATSLNGNVAECVQTITSVDEQTPSIELTVNAVAGCDPEAAFDVTLTDNCDPTPDVTIDITNEGVVFGDDCDPGQLRTQTIGGWGTNPSGNNPGVYLDAHFDAAFPNGLTIGCENTLTLTSAQAVRDFLPSGSTPTMLPEGQLVDPGQGYNNVFAAQLVGLTLSTTFDAYDPDFGASDFSLDEAIMLEGGFQGMTVAELLDLGNQLIGGCLNGVDASSLNDAISTINENYVDGTTNNGNLGCGFIFDCAIQYTVQVTATDACGNVANEELTVYLEDTSAPVITVFPEDVTVECDEIPAPEIVFEDDCSTEFVEVEVTEEEFSGTCHPTIQRTYTLTDPCGNTTTHVQYITVVDTTAPTFVNEPSDMVLNCGDEIPDFTPEAEDNCGTPLITLDETTSSIDCGTLIIRTWTATDACGNTTSINQQIFIEDNEGPSPVNALSDAMVSCDNIPPYSEVVFEDDCSEILEVNISEEQVGEGCEYLLVRTYTASDVCGNTTVLMQTLTVVDETAPEFVSVPENEILNCGTEIPELSPVAIDQCSEVVLAYSDEWLDGEGCAQLLRTWSATDDCGNIATAETVYTFIDEEAPVLSGVPQGGSVGCEDLTDNAIVTAMDACDGQIPVFMDETVATENCMVTITRVWTATDYCGNVASAEVVFTYEDNAAPSITAEPEVTIECAELQASNLIEVIDDCDFALEIGFEEILLEGDAQGCNRTLERTWFASDACGNEASFTQIINVVDESAPIFEFVPADIEVACGETPPYEEPVATDNCTDVTVALAFELVSNGCNDQLIRTWTATDNCGNSSSAQQVVTFVDTEAPELSEAPADLVLDCEASIPDAVVLTGTDNCGDVTIEFVESIIDGDCPSEYTIERTWTAVDNCGNTATRVQMISITDTTAPIFDFTPEDITAECGDIPAPPVLTAADNCGEVTIDYSEDVDAGGCPNIYRTWIASDGCGNETMFVQTVFVQDTEPPVLTGIPGDMEVSCSTIPVMPEPEVSDNCDQDVAVTANESIVGSGCEFTIIRTWIASDDCGNTTIVSQSLNVTDTEAPVFVEAPQDITIECTEIDLIPLPEVFDDCAATVNISYEDSVLGSGCNYDIERTYTATDNCGQSATATQLIHVVDTTAPVISGVGANTFVDCSMVPEPDAAVAVDGCGGAVELEVVDTFIDQDACNYIISRTYIATDECGNGTALTQLIYVSDVQEPVFIGLPDDITVDCTENAPAAPNVGATDNCSANVTVSMAEISEENGCSTIITRIWSATDDCGNTAMATRTVTITDLTAPIFDEVPANETVSCDAIPEVITPSATDNCDDSVEVNYNEEVIAGGCPYEIRRTFIAVDDCGNETIAVQQIFVIDNEAPVLVDLPQDLVVTCAELPAPANVTATDNCSGATVLFEEQIGGDGCMQILNRTWTAIDLCGNTTSYTQSITVIDESAPIFLETPEDLTVSCLMVPEFVMLEAYDDCGIADVQMEEIITETECITEYSILRIWTITDACGLSSSYSQQIEVVDDIAPILVNVPENVTVDCDNIPEIPEVSAIESCGEVVDVTFTEEIIVSENDNDDCEVGNASGLAGDIALWLPGVDGVTEVYVYGPNGGTLTLNEANGTAHLTGEVFSVDNANHSFMLDVHLHEQRTWDEWSALGRDYKDDLGIAVDDFMDWSYFILNGETSRLIGTGSFEGSELSMSHAPSDSTFGFQLGMNANNFSEGYGLGGWFFYEGELNGQAVNGVGDVFTENYCCQDQEIIRTWTAIDCAGNVATYTQTITVTNLIPDGGPQLIFVDDYDTGFDVRGSAGDDFIITYEPTFSGAASIALFDLQGHQLDVIYDAQVIEGAVYTLRVPKAGLTPGVYVFTAAGDNRILTDTEMVLR
ncbi:LamG domain-containing protein [Sanyastnella coralliicola]|uniref:LamG domain-containing protein n=1 Tax=Sanyastnella coralliicola TaxID=3069118 RepID=UPI0027BAC6B1|nr:LamG domain-containing protein [Longitalea sp. SCSIO 12813]